MHSDANFKKITMLTRAHSKRNNNNKDRVKKNNGYFLKPESDFRSVRPEKTCDNTSCFSNKL